MVADAEPGTAIESCRADLAHNKRRTQRDAKAARHAKASPAAAATPPSDGTPSDGPPDNGRFKQDRDRKAAERPVGSQKHFKTKMCSFDLMGKCRKGQACNFAHSEDELLASDRGNKAFNNAAQLPTPPSPPQTSPSMGKRRSHNKVHEYKAQDLIAAHRATPRDVVPQPQFPQQFTPPLTPQRSPLLQPQMLPRGLAQHSMPMAPVAVMPMALTQGAQSMPMMLVDCSDGLLSGTSAAGDGTCQDSGCAPLESPSSFSTAAPSLQGSTSGMSMLASLSEEQETAPWSLSNPQTPTWPATVSNGTPPPAMYPDGGDANGRKKFFKTKACRFHQWGRCRRGADCNFAHDDTERKELPDLFRTKLCPDLLQKFVCHNPNCRFAHDQGELRRTEDAMPRDRAQRKSQESLRRNEHRRPQRNSAIGIGLGAGLSSLDKCFSGKAIVEYEDIVAASRQSTNDTIGTGFAQSSPALSPEPEPDLDAFQIGEFGADLRVIQTPSSQSQFDHFNSEVAYLLPSPQAALRVKNTFLEMKPQSNKGLRTVRSAPDLEPGAEAGEHEDLQCVGVAQPEVRERSRSMHFTSFASEPGRATAEPC